MKKKGHFTTVLLFLILLAGLSLLLYPSLANYWNSFHSTRAISKYTEDLDNASQEELDALWRAAVEYNETLYRKGTSFPKSDLGQQKYQESLNVGGSGVMGYIDIPSIEVELPIYHGTADSVLQVAVGHLDWTSLPVGGINTHCVLSGHRGLPSAKLFTNLDELREGDLFTLNVLNVTLTYEVDQIRTVLPSDTTYLQVEEGKDYCTLVTCTPYGINTHRMLVRGHRIENVIGEARVVSEAVLIEPLLVAPVVAAPFLLALLLVVLFKRPKKQAEFHRHVD